MGTRNLTAVMIGGEYKIAQYGQWDGYPSGQGTTALNFLHNCDLEEFKAAVRKTRFLNDDEMNLLGSNWKETHPQLSRDNGAGILSMVYGGVEELKSSIGFAGDSLMCEYAYVIDLDKGSFEVFEGFNKEKVTSGRFVSGDPILESDDEYDPVKLVKEYSLDSLPTEAEFLLDLETEDEE